MYTWIAELGIVNLFQTFEDLESAKDKQVDIKALRALLAEVTDVEEKTASMQSLLRNLSGIGLMI